MIVKLKGKLEYYCDDFVDLETQGVVYRIFITEKLSKSFNHLGEFCSTIECSSNGQQFGEPIRSFGIRLETGIRT